VTPFFCIPSFSIKFVQNPFKIHFQNLKKSKKCGGRKNFTFS
jgi:hypothetical protein